jgi:FkbH-like protein
MKAFGTLLHLMATPRYGPSSFGFPQQMKLIEALEVLRGEAPVDARAFRVCLVAGFNPLHFQTFLAARIRQMLPDRRPEIVAGLYGDLWGNLERAADSQADVCVVLAEFADFDPRLGIRSLGSWSPEALADILDHAKTRSAQFLPFIGKLSGKMPVVISFPTLPLPPVAFTPGWQASQFALELRLITSALSVEVARVPNVRVINSERLDQLSPSASRFDVKSELVSGFPYRLPHASVLAELVSHAAHPPLPKKGLITDLDDTLWDGILGEVGAAGVSWDLDHHSHMHGVYQRLLRALSETGVLVAAASKNDAELVEQALGREDLLLTRSALFPVEAHWEPKSHSVSRILKSWNIGADSVVFIDDSPMELAEVKAAHPGVECILFRKDDPQAIAELLYRLRDLFGKSALSEEDSIRRESIRQLHVREEQMGMDGGSADDFLKRSEAELLLSFSKSPLDPRALELVNKTNQFNLNGERYSEASWADYIHQPDTVFLVAAYRDKYGPLGKIAVLAGRKTGKEIVLNVWVMSCRAFSRRIEYRCLRELFERYDVDRIEFDFRPTSKNRPTQDFLATILGEAPTPQCGLSRRQFMESSAETFHRVLEVANG